MSRTRGRNLLARLGHTVAAAAVAGMLSAAPAMAQDKSEVVVALVSDALTLDPSKDSSPMGLNLFRNIFDQLTSIEADGSVRPMLASEWEVNADATEWTFTIRDNAFFHDGSPITIEDVAWSFQKILDDEKSPVRPHISSVTSVEIVGEHQVKFTLSAGFAPFHRNASLVSIMPKAVYEADPVAFSNKPVGSGAFSVVDWVKDDRITLQAFDKYYGGQPTFDRVIFRPVPSEATRTAALLSGEIDIVPLLPPAFIDTAEARDDIRVEKVNSNRIVYLGFNVNAAPLDNLELRQAIDMAIDRKAISESLLRGLGTPVGQIVAPVTFGFDPAIEPSAYDPERAKELVAASGYDGTPIPFQFPTNAFAFGREVAQATVGYLNEIGVKVDMQAMEYTAFFPLWSNRELKGIHLFAYGPSIMDAELPLRNLFASSSRGYWTNEEVDELIRKQRTVSDPQERQELISQVWNIAREHVNYSFLYNEVQAYGIAKGIDWMPRPDERLLFVPAAKP